MKKLLRLGASGLAGSALLCVFGLVLLPWLGGPALFGADFEEVYRMLIAEQVRGEALETRDGAILRCLEGKQGVTAALIAGRLTLAEAAERFERLTGLLDDGQDDVLGAYQSAGTDRSELYRNVILWVKVTLHDKPRERAEVIDRLERERARLEAGQRPV